MTDETRMITHFVGDACKGGHRTDDTRCVAVTARAEDGQPNGLCGHPALQHYTHDGKHHVCWQCDLKVASHPYQPGRPCKTTTTPN